MAYSRIPANTSTPLSARVHPTAESSCADARSELSQKRLRRVACPGVFFAAVSDADARALTNNPATLPTLLVNFGCSSARARFARDFATVRGPKSLCAVDPAAEKTPGHAMRPQTLRSALTPDSRSECSVAPRRLKNAALSSGPRSPIVRGGVGQAVAARDERVEESPGSQGTVPGNAWGARAHGKCNRKYTA